VLKVNSYNKINCKLYRYLAASWNIACLGGRGRQSWRAFHNDL